MFLGSTSVQPAEVPPPTSLACAALSEPGLVASTEHFLDVPARSRPVGYIQGVEKGTHII